MKRLYTLLFLSIGILIALSHKKIDPSQKTLVTSPIIFIYDASGSMWGQLEGRSKMEMASTVLSDALDKLPEQQQIGLVAYGHRRQKDCEDVEFLIDMKNESKEEIRKALRSIKPLGRTPLAYAALKVIEQLRSTKTKATIILVTDGIEVCGGDLCGVIRQARGEGINFKLHIIGFGLKEADIGPLKCAAEASDGEYYSAADAGSLSIGLEEATAATIDQPESSALTKKEKNFSVYAIKNGEPVDAWVVAFKAGTNEKVSNIRTYSDTSYLSLPPGKYDLHFGLGYSNVASLIAYNVEQFPDSIGHKTMSFDAGKSSVITTNNGEGWDATVNIYSSASGKRVGGGRTYGKAKINEMNPGIYDIVVSAMKLKGADIEYRFENIEIKAGETTEVSHDFTSGNLSVATTNNGEGWDATISVVSKKTGRSVASGRTYGSDKNFLITPGLYDVSFGAMRMTGPEIKSEPQTVVVKANESTIVNHDFKSGILKIGARAKGEMVAATVSITDTDTGRYYNGGRTSTTARSNPKVNVITTGSYKILVTNVKSYEKQEYIVQLKAGTVVEKIIEF